MEVRLVIEPGQLGETVLELFTSLSPKAKRNLTLDIMREWLKDPSTIETAAKEAELLLKFKRGEISPDWSSRTYDMNTPDDRIRSDSKFKKLMDEFRHSKSYMIEAIKNEIVTYYKEEVNKQVAADDSLKETMKVIKDVVMENLPAVMTQYMTSMFIDIMKGHSSTLENGAFMANQHQYMIDQIRQRLNM